MGHLIDCGFLKSKNKKQAVEEGYSIACEFAYYNGDRHEGSDNYHGNFKFYDKKFVNEDDALNFFDLKGSYVDGVVMVKQATNASTKRFNNKVKKLQDKINLTKQKHIENFKNRKSKSVGCKKCGKRFTSEEALANKLLCPNCGELFGGEGIRKRIITYKEKIKEAEDQYVIDKSQTGEYRYWYKCEIHC